MCVFRGLGALENRSHGVIYQRRSDGHAVFTWWHSMLGSLYFVSTVNNACRDIDSLSRIAEHDQSFRDRFALVCDRTGHSRNGFPWTASRSDHPYGEQHGKPHSLPRSRRDMPRGAKAIARRGFRHHCDWPYRTASEYSASPPENARSHHRKPRSRPLHERIGLHD